MLQKDDFPVEERWYEYYSRQIATYVFCECVQNSQSSNYIVYFSEIEERFDMPEEALDDKLIEMAQKELLQCLNMLDAEITDDEDGKAFDVIVGYDYNLDHLECMGNEDDEWASYEGTEYHRGTEDDEDC